MYLIIQSCLIDQTAYINCSMKIKYDQNIDFIELIVNVKGRERFLILRNLSFDTFIMIAEQKDVCSIICRHLD
jgi:hypothetical protein